MINTADRYAPADFFVIGDTMLRKIIPIFFIASIIFGCSDLNNIDSPSKDIKKVDEFVFAEGRWKALSGTTARIISKVNFTSITCDRNSKTCKEIISYVFAPKESRIHKKSTLYSDKFTYQIIDWNNDVIKAKGDAPVADIEITISLKDNFAEKSYRETKARGSESANPDIYGKWMLE
jgi:hypothetical protein